MATEIKFSDLTSEQQEQIKTAVTKELQNRNIPQSQIASIDLNNMNVSQNNNNLAVSIGDFTFVLPMPTLTKDEDKKDIWHTVLAIAGTLAGVYLGFKLMKDAK